MRTSFLFLLAAILIAGSSCRRQNDDQDTGDKVLSWDFPLERPHEGILLGNGTQGLMVWGGGNRLVLTVSRAGFWDHRGSVEFATETTYRLVKWYLQTKNEERLRQVFHMDENSSSPVHPHQIGGGRVNIEFPSEWELIRGDLNLSKGDITLLIRNDEGKERTIRIVQDPESELSFLVLPRILSNSTGIALESAWEFNRETFAQQGISSPVRWKTDFGEGFCQFLPDDKPLALGWKKKEETIIIATALARNAPVMVKEKLETADFHASEKAAISWWKAYWAAVPSISLPDPVLQEIADYGLYKQACTTAPQGVPCTLQGPFMEIYQLPPWSNDYHFNINAEMIYWPALASNRTSHLEPLWKMLWSWMPEMKTNAAHFFENDSALTIPHAVDDRGNIPGVFWTGMIDHASTAWMAQLAWLNYRYTMDRQILDTLALPLMKGAFEGYWSMLDKIPLWGGGYRYSLAVSVSPEFRGSSMDAWGRDASFQLAAVHMLTGILQQAAEIRGEEPDPRWKDVEEHLPMFAVVTGPESPEYPAQQVQRIGLWDGLDLPASHRHHSHLASIYPFSTVDPADTLYAEIIDASIRHWIREGSGNWSGWCIPWASVIHSRTGNSEAAVGWLHYWKEHYTNNGRGTLHDADYPGFSMITSPCWEKTESEMHEIMQLDGGFGALNAVLELLVSNRQGKIYVLPDLHRDWKDLSFTGVLAEGAFLIDAKVENGRITMIRVKSLKGGELKLVPGIRENFLLNGQSFNGEVVRKDMKTGEVLEIRAL
ncbi:MAG: glycosyl hydrolase family 95 catalytic domain-containing protein [Bacteroidota bacterium]